MLLQAQSLQQAEVYKQTEFYNQSVGAPLPCIHCCLYAALMKARLWGPDQVHGQCLSGAPASCSPMGMRVFAWEAQHPRRQQSPPLHPVHCAKMKSMRVRGTFQENQHGPAFATPACSLQLNPGAGYRVQGLAQTLRTTTPTPQNKAQRTPAGKVTVLVPKPMWHPADQ